MNGTVNIVIYSHDQARQHKKSLYYSGSELDSIFLQTISFIGELVGDKSSTLTVSGAVSI